MSSNLAYQEESWDELIGGQVVLMSPRPTVDHNFVSGNIYRIFGHYLRKRACTPFGDGVDLFLAPGDRFVPDGMIVCDRSKIKQDGVHGAPDLVVEVLSPSTVKNDRGHKKDSYGRHGVREYWIVSPREKSVEQYLLEDGALVLHEVYSVYPEGFLKKMTEEERAAVVTEFKCSLFDDLIIRLEDVFERVE